MQVSDLNGVTVRLTLNLSLVNIAGTYYLSDMHQDTINKYDAYYDDGVGKWIKVECLNDLMDATHDSIDCAACYTFIKVPIPANDGGSSCTLRQRILNHYNKRHIPSANIEIVKDLY